MRVLRRVSLRQISAYLAVLTLALISGPRERASAQAPAQRWDGLFELVSARYDSAPPWPGTPQPAEAASRTSRHAISDDGRYVVFTSDTTNWGNSTPGIYRRDRRTGQTELLLGYPAPHASISGDGDHVTFDICEPWMRPDALAICDAWSLDLRSWTWAPLSTSPDGTFGNDASGEAVFSRNGRFAVFVTKAANLTGGTSSARQVVLRDRDADGNRVFDEPGTVVLETISVGGPGGTVLGDGDSDSAEVSDDGRFVAFRSAASNLVPGDRNDTRDLFVRDRQMARTRRLNVRPGGQESMSPIDSTQISMSGDGRYVAFASTDGLLAPGSIDDTNGALDVFVHDQEAYTLSRIDIGWGPPVAAGYIPGNGPTGWPTLSADGRYVSLESQATNVETPPGDPGRTHVYVVDRADQRVTRISVKPDGQDPDRDAKQPAISGDGSVVLFWSQATNLVSTPIPPVDQLYAAVHLEIAPAEVLVPGRGGNASFSVATQQHTLWWAEWDWEQAWFGPEMSAPYGVGNGTMEFAAREANPDPVRRSATVRSGQSSATFTQDVGLSLASISPAAGPMSGGTTVTLRGTGFEPGMFAFIGERVDTEFVDSTTLTLVTAAHDRRETVPVSIGTPDGRWAWLDNAFAFTDNTPPQVMGWMTGTEGQNGWYSSDVAVNWGWWDPEAEVTSTTCTNFVVTADTPGTTYSCSATSEGGTGYGTVTVKRDATPPAVTIAVPAPQQLVELNSTVASSFTCSDNVSGVDTCGAGMPSGSPLDSSSPGWQIFSPVAADHAGNFGMASVEYAVSNGVCTPPANGLQTWLRFDGDLDDVMSTNGTINAGMPPDSYVQGESGQAYKFVSRGSQALEHWHDGRLNFGSAMTVAMWLKPEAATLGTLVKHKDQYRLERTAHGTINWLLIHPGTVSSFGTSYAKAPLNTWSHVVFTYDAGIVKVYVNGRLDRTWTWSAPALQPTYWNNIRIGGPDLGYGAPYVGGFDELQFFNRALGDGEIEQIFLSGASGLCAPAPTVLEVPSPISATYAAGTYPAVAFLRDVNGAPLPGKTIRLEQRAYDLAGEPLASTTMITDANGAVRWDAPFDVVAGTYSPGFTAHFAGDLEHAHSPWVSATVVVQKAAPQITWAAPAAITYGTALSYYTQLNATASVAGSFSYSPGSGAVPPAGSQTLTANFLPSDWRNYASASASVSIEVARALPAITVTGSTVTYDGQPHPATASATDYRGVALTPVTVTYNGSTDVPVAAGVYTAVATFAGDANHLPHSATATVTINKATPSIVFSTPLSFIYDGQPHGLTASVYGVGGALLQTLPVTYDGASEAPANAGVYAASATFEGTASYASRTATATLRINPATPVVTVGGGPFTYDQQPHGATVTVSGVGGAAVAGPVVVSYNGAPDVPVNAGTYAVLATYAGSSNYAASSGSGTLTVSKATPTFVVGGGTVTYDGQPHATTAIIAGSYGDTLEPYTLTYNGLPDPPVNAGAYQVVATYGGAANYEAATATGTLTIEKATIALNVVGGTFTYDGQPHPAAAIATGVAGETLSPVNVTYWRIGFGWFDVPIATGTYDVAATFPGSANYLPKTERTTVVIGRATPVLTWSAPGSIVYGTALGAAQLNAVSSVPGSFSYSPGAGTRLNAGAGQSLTATFVPADPANYTIASVSTSVTVTPAPLTVRANDAVKPFGAPLPAFAATFIGLVNGESPASLGGALAFGTTAMQTSPVGTYPIVPAGVFSPNYAIAFVNGALTIVKGAVAVSVSTSPEPSGFQMPMTFTATVAVVAPAVGSPSGSVSFFDGTTLLGTAAISGGVATLTTAGLDAGVRAIEAVYDGDTAFATGIGSSSHTVNSAATTPVLSLSSSRNPSTVGQSVTLTANISMSAGPVSGTVAFYDGATLLGSAAISAGRATLTTTALPAGSHAITARYLGGAAPASTSAVFVQAVGSNGWKNRATTTTLAASADPSALGDVVVLTATVSGSSSTTPTGRVLFMVNGQVVGDAQGVAVTGVPGTTVQAAVSVPGLAHGRHSVTATYLGDSTYKGSSAAVTQIVN